ncbi:hypothetical protein V8B97DRAFT_1915852 [Scleroderma yunnanense]
MEDKAGVAAISQTNTIKDFLHQHVTRLLDNNQIAMCLEASTYSIKCIISHLQAYGDTPYKDKNLAGDHYNTTGHLQDINIEFQLAFTYTFSAYVLDSCNVGAHASQQQRTASVKSENHCLAIKSLLELSISNPGKKGPKLTNQVPTTKLQFTDQKLCKVFLTAEGNVILYIFYFLANFFGGGLTSYSIVN